MITAQLEPAEHRASGVWDYISPSRLNLWLKCPLAFRLRYVDGIRSPPSQAQFVGKAVHRAAEFYYRHRQLGITLSVNCVTRYISESWDRAVQDEGLTFSSSADESAFQHEAVRLVETYLAQLPADEPRPLAVETTLEQPLVDPDTGEDLGIPLLGVLDLVLDDPTGPSIVDFKTAKRSSSALDVVHEVQLSSYAWLFRQSAGRREGSLEIRSLVKTKTPKIVTHEFPARRDVHFRRLFTVVRAYLDNLDSGRFVFRPGWNCATCDFQSHCQGWLD